MAKGGSKQRETNDEKERARQGLEYQQRYEKFSPLMDQLIRDVRDTRPEQQRAQGIAATNSALAFGRARTQAQAGLSAAGVRPGSGRYVSAIPGMARDAGTSAGLGQIDTKAAIDNQRVAGLQSLTQIGRGEQAEAITGLSDVADMSSQQAAADAMNSAGNRAAMRGAVGTAAGLGAAYGLTPKAPDMVSAPQLDYDASRNEFAQNGLTGNDFSLNDNNFSLTRGWR